MATTTTTATIDDQIRTVGQRWVNAELAGDVDTLAGLVTDDFRLIGPFGFVLDKGQWLDRYRSGAFVTAELSWHDVHTRQHGDAVIAIGTQTQQAEYKDTPTSGDYRVTHVFVRDNDTWIIANI